MAYEDEEEELAAEEDVDNGDDDPSGLAELAGVLTATADKLKGVTLCRGWS